MIAVPILTLAEEGRKFTEQEVASMFDLDLVCDCENLPAGILGT